MFIKSSAVDNHTDEKDCLAGQKVHPFRTLIPFSKIAFFES
jgi:hypothetical protein